jgi:hypothetical protein
MKNFLISASLGAVAVVLYVVAPPPTYEGVMIVRICGVINILSAMFWAFIWLMPKHGGRG